MTVDPNTIETWKFVNTFAPWLAALGSVAAVVTSLYLATRQTKVRLRLTAAHHLTVWTGAQLLPPEILDIEIVNVGLRDVEVAAIEWRAGLRGKRCLVQMPCNDGFSSRLPIRLAYGETARYVIPFHSWVRQMREYLRPFARAQACLLGIQVRTSVGQIIGGRVEKKLRREIIKSFGKLQAPDAP